MDGPIAGPPAWYEWNDVRWYRTAKDGYYRERNGFLLHVALWVAEHGPVPDGHEVHHRDHDRAHNELRNLICLSASEHRSYHAFARTDDAWTDQQHAEARRGSANALWEQRKANPPSRTCVECSGTFTSPGMRSKLCSADCRRAYHRKMAAQRRAERRRTGTR